LEEAQQDFQTFVHDPNKQMCLGALRWKLPEFEVIKING
jgi:hypothetical protein